jgi:hypothetical protein
LLFIPTLDCRINDVEGLILVALILSVATLACTSIYIVGSNGITANNKTIKLKSLVICCCLYFR